MVIIFILLLVLFFLFVLDKSMEKFISLSMLKRVPDILCPKNKVLDTELLDTELLDTELLDTELLETELLTVNKSILRDVDELMFSPKEGETIYDYTSV